MSTTGGIEPLLASLVKVFGFVASLLASCKGKKEKKRKKYILLFMREGVPFARTP